MLQIRMRMVIDGCEDLHHEYNAQLEQESTGQMGMLSYAMQRATGKTWYGTICSMLRRLTDATTTQRLQLTPPARNQALNVGDVEMDPQLEREFALLTEYSSLILSLASQRSWSQAFYGMAFPHCLARLMARDARNRNLVKKLAKGILLLEKAIEENPQNSHLQRLLANVGTNVWVVTREAFIAGEKSDWDIDSPDGELRAMCFALFAGPNSTKASLENTFSAIKDAVSRYNKNKRQCGPSSKWLYTSTAPYADQGGVKQMMVEKSDISEFLHAGLTVKGFLASKPFHARKHSIADAVPDPAVIKYEARKAGPAPNRAAAAASAMILYSMDRHFESVSDSWAGPHVKIVQLFMAFCCSVVPKFTSTTHFRNFYPAVKCGWIAGRLFIQQGMLLLERFHQEVLSLPGVWLLCYASTSSLFIWNRRWGTVRSKLWLKPLLFFWLKPIVWKNRNAYIMYMYPLVTWCGLVHILPSRGFEFNPAHC